jgi:putative FmdB family regulatory protein
MPVYEYYCEGCRCRFEEYREVNQRSVCPCPTCGKSARKTFRPVGIIFKGSGFHSTDYRTPAEKAKSESDSPKLEGAGIASDKDAKKD